MFFPLCYPNYSDCRARVKPNQPIISMFFLIITVAELIIVPIVSTIKIASIFYFLRFFFTLYPKEIAPAEG